MKLCPLCHNQLRQNDWKDYICRCSGSLLCLKDLEKLAKLQEQHFYSLELKSPSNVNLCNKLQSEGFVYVPGKQVFSKKFFTKAERDRVQLQLLDFGFIILPPEP